MTPPKLWFPTAGSDVQMALSPLRLELTEEDPLAADADGELVVAVSAC